MDYRVGVRISASRESLTSELAGGTRELNQFGAAGQRAGAQAAGGIRQVGSAARDTAGSIQNLVASYVGFQTVRAVTDAADQMASYRARIDLVTDSQQELNAAVSQATSIAQSTRSDLGSVVGLYTKLQAATDSLGGSQADALQLVETITQSYKVSGATAAETSNSIQQFSQALASGVLRGDEFNSMAEQSPRLMQALAAGLGVTRGQLRGMAEDGELTTARIVAALKSQSAAIQDDFSQIPLTTGDALQQLETASKIAFDGIFGDGNTALAQFISAFASGVQQLPQTLSVAVTEAISFFDILRIGATEEIQQLVLSAIDKWLAIEAGASALAGNVQIIFARMASAVASSLLPLAQSVSALSAKVGLDTSSIDGFVAGLGRLEKAEATVTAAVTQRQAAIDASRAALAQQSADYSQQAAQQIQASLDAVEATKAQAASELQLVAASTERGKATSGATAASKADAQTTKAATSALEKLTAAHAEAAGVLNGPVKAAQAKYAEEIRKIDELETKLRAGKLVTAQVEQQLNDLRTAAGATRDREIAQLTQGADALDRYEASLQAELATATLSDEQREERNTRLRAEEGARKAVTEAIEAGNRSLVDSEGRLTAEANARIKAAGDTAVHAAAVRDATQAQADSVSVLQGKIEAEIDGVSGALADFLSGTESSWSDTWDNMGNITKRFFSDLIKTYLVKPFVMNIVANFTSAGQGGLQGLAQSLLGGGQGGGLSGLLGSLGGGVNGGVFSTI
ncbi:MAG: tape measure protein, partial [Burkholderiaceae bacterium]